MNKKNIAILLTAVLGMTVLVGCGREPEPLTDEATLLLMEREILRRDRTLPPEYVQYHIEHGGLPAEEEESDTVRQVLHEVERYLPEDISGYISQADKIVQDMGDVMSQAQGVMSQVDELTSGAGKEIMDGLLSEAGQRLNSALDEYADPYDQVYDDEHLEPQIGNPALGGADSMDDAVRAYASGLYNKDITQWQQTLPAGFMEAHPDYATQLDQYLTSFEPNNLLPGGLDSLSYTIEEDLTEGYLEGGRDQDQLTDIYAKYGVNNIDGVWAVEMNFDSGENDTLIVRSNGKYYATYALAYLLSAYGEDYHGCMY